MDLKKAKEYIKALKNGEKFPKKNMFLIMFLLGALLFVIVLTIYHGFQSVGVDNAAHIGGVVGGVLLTALLYRR